MAPRMKKQTKSTHDDDLEKTTKTSFFKQRFPGFKKKAIELSVLCGNSVGFICYGPNNDQVHAWPENPQALENIVSLFDEQNNVKKKKNSCDLRDFPQFDDGLSVEELKTHLSALESKLVGVKQRKLQVVIKTLKTDKTPSSKDRSRVQETGVGILDPKMKPCLEDQHVKASHDQKMDTKLGFGGAFDELGCVVSGSTNVTTSISECEPDKTLLVSKDDGALLAMETEGYTPTLGFESQLYSVPETYHHLPMGIWDLDMSSTLGDSFMTNTCQDNWGNVNLQGFQTHPFNMWEQQPLL